ncbi:sensor domain-containing diguanylate cyclase [Pseudoalteromonas tetraodonis]|uniref:sensor domain-containing diguanylate cyclase n=1 Tax=Pseudoalteromonas tetraodonis TaxID=43659 RepID=UPI001BDE2071|nr:diguanylate cyclase [Pseudoalteromonas tetraodonis]MBT2152660.1 sensor domain-containing diguanylate cyclase [Pseudoalteromonas tetraodonis]
MNYASQAQKVKSYVVELSTKVQRDDCLVAEQLPHNVKESAYQLFYQTIRVPRPYRFEEPNPISKLFRLIEHSLDFINPFQQVILKQLEKWWLEWHFVATMNASLEMKHVEQQRFVSSATEHPMRKHELSHYAKLFTILPLPVCNVCMVTGDILKLNQRFVDVFGYTIDDIPNLKQWWKVAYPEPSYRESVQTMWGESLAQANKNNDDIPANDYQIVCKDGSKVIMQVSGISVESEFIAVFNDATERLKTQEILSDMAFLDSLTKIANRRRFDEKLHAEFKKLIKVNTQLSMIIIDIDNFKKFNDRYGHVAGDKCLHSVAQKLAETVSRPEDFVARYGGEEFVVLLPQTDDQGALFIAEQIQKSIEDLAIAHEDSFTGFLSVSMGVHTVKHGEKTNHVDFFKATDSALYYAKKQGRNCIALGRHE